MGIDFMPFIYFTFFLQLFRHQNFNLASIILFISEDLALWYLKMEILEKSSKK